MYSVWDSLKERKYGERSGLIYNKILNVFSLFEVKFYFSESFVSRRPIPQTIIVGYSYALCDTSHEKVLLSISTTVFNLFFF